jgi:hypothetical protein
MILRERVALHAPMALRLVDVVTGSLVTANVAISVAARAGGSAITAIRSRGGIWTAAGLPGLRGYERGNDDSVAARRAARRPFRITIGDSTCRYLPFAFNADLPTDDLTLSPPGTLPGLPWAGASSSPPVPVLAAIPMFPAPGYPIAAPLGAIRAELREAGSGRPAGWALLQARIGGIVRGLGLADQLGRVLVPLSYPPPSPRVLTSPPQPAASHWSVELTAFYRQPAAGGAAPDVADLAGVLAQLATPRRLLADTASPPNTLAPVDLEEGVPLVVRSLGPMTPSPYLFLDAA